MRALAAEDPRVVGGYRLVARLGEGGMGRVYVGRSEGGRTVAVKLVRPELARRPEFRRRFEREVEAARRVGGQWTAPVLDADAGAEAPWVATGYVAGPSLQEVVTGEYGPLPARSLLALANGLARALRDVHAAGLVHRDLKPANVLVTIDGPRVIDFGIARAVEAASGAGLTRTGVTVGTPGYMSPEQIRGEPLTPASDVFSLGSVLAFAATGRGPFGDAEIGMPGLLVRVLQDDKDLSGVPEGIKGLIEDCLTPQPAGRPALERLLERTAAGDLWDLGPGVEPWVPGPLVAGLGRHAVRLLDFDAPPPLPGPAVDRVPTVLDGSEPPEPGQPSRRPGRRTGIALACTVVGVSLLGIGGWFLFDADSDRGFGGGKGRSPAATASTDGEGGTGGSPSAGPSAGLSASPSEGGITAKDVAGLWEGEAQRGDSARVFHRFDLTDGEVGDTIGTAHALFPKALCVAKVTLASVDTETLTITTDRLHDVPKGSCTFTGRSTLRLSGNALVWQDGNLTAALKPTADRGRSAAVPGDYLGTWGFTDTSGHQHTLTVSQGEVTRPVITWIRQGSDGTRCTWRHTLIAVAPDQGWLLLGPSSDTAATPAGTCEDADMPAFRLQAPEETTGAVLHLLPEGTGTQQLKPVD